MAGYITLVQQHSICLKQQRSYFAYFENPASGGLSTSLEASAQAVVSRKRVQRACILFVVSNSYFFGFVVCCILVVLLGEEPTGELSETGGVVVVIPAGAW